MSRKRPVVIAKDGLRARESGAWGKQKLEFIDRFGPPALNVTKSKRQRVYLDLFAGPGLNVARDGGGEEFDGSPLRALKMHAPGNPDVCFTDAILVNRVLPDHEALTERVARLVASGECRIPLNRIRLVHADANEALPAIMDSIPRFDYVFTFADIEGIKEWPWRSVENLKALGHQSVDLYMLFPIRQAFQRLMSFKLEYLERYAPRFDAFFGSEEWRECLPARITNSHTKAFLLCLEAVYLRRLKTRWNHARIVRTVYEVGDKCLYKMLFASNNAVAAKLVKWEEGAGDPPPLEFDFT
ncbi:MAG: three-Cys-motif partner protein TcmP [Gemmatimonadaceae bacterium]|nr:three-Cys-motif partner protein TcmP [Gemmatimonadaceae bacterium]